MENTSLLLLKVLILIILDLELDRLLRLLTGWFGLTMLQIDILIGRP